MAAAAPYALIDRDNSYVSCERVFDRRLEGVPAPVPSNDDGFLIGLPPSSGFSEPPR